MKQRTLQKKSKEANIQLLILNIIAVSRTVVREKIGVLSALHTRDSPDTNLPFSFNVPYNHYFDNKACIFYAAWNAFCISNVSLKHAVSPLTRALSVVQSFFWDAFSSCVFPLTYELLRHAIPKTFILTENHIQDCYSLPCWSESISWNDTLASSVLRLADICIERTACTGSIHRSFYCREIITKELAGIARRMENKPH